MLAEVSIQVKVLRFEPIPGRLEKRLSLAEHLLLHLQPAEVADRPALVSGIRHQPREIRRIETQQGEPVTIASCRDVIGCGPVGRQIRTKGE